MSPEVTKILANLLQMAVVAGVTYLIRGQAKHENSLTELKTTLIGMDGKNGIRGDVTELKDKAENQWRKIADHETRITVIEAKEGAA